MILGHYKTRQLATARYTFMSISRSCPVCRDPIDYLDGHKQGNFPVRLHSLNLQHVASFPSGTAWQLQPH